MCPSNTDGEFSWFKEDNNGNTVLIADEGYNTTFLELEAPLEILLKTDAHLYTLQKNRIYKLDDKVKIDMGPIVAALEYASGKQAEILGKPSKTLFKTIAEDFGVSFEEILMVGDDIEFDILLPMAYGIHGVCVKTGKYIQHIYDEICSEYQRHPDALIENISEIFSVL